MSMTLNERNPNIVDVIVGTQAASINLPSPYFRKHSRIKEVRYVDQAGIAASNANYITMSLQDTLGNVYATLDTRATGQGAVTAFVALALALPNPDVTGEDPASENPASNQETDIPAGTQLKLLLVAVGTVTTTLGRLLIEYYPA
jgi:hypothetical protein